MGSYGAVSFENPVTFDTSLLQEYLVIGNWCQIVPNLHVLLRIRVQENRENDQA